MRYTKLLVLAAALMVLPVRSAHANLITNGSFEDPDVAPGNYALYTSIPGWTSGNGNQFEIQDHAGAGLPQHGDQFLELDGNVNSTVDSNGIPTFAGFYYTLSLYYSPRPGVAAGNNRVDVWIDGVFREALDGAGGAGPNDTNWQLHTYAVTGDGSTLVEFRGMGANDGVGGYIDNVVFDLNPDQTPPVVPEPTSMILTGLGMAATGVARRWRKK
jgi:hypothetical protein